MKKNLIITIIAILTLLFASLTAVCYLTVNGSIVEIFNLKYITFILIGFMIVICLYKEGKSITRKRHILTCIISSISTAVICFFLNNLYHWIDWNSMSYWDFVVSYFRFIKNDITYTYGVGILRYVFYAAFVVFEYFIVWFSVKNKAKLKEWLYFDIQDEDYED